MKEMQQTREQRPMDENREMELLRKIEALVVERDRLRLALDIARTALLHIERQSEQARADLTNGSGAL